MIRYSVVVPTTGRASLATLLSGLAGDERPQLAAAGIDAWPDSWPEEVIIVNDRPQLHLRPLVPAGLAARTTVVAGTGGGPASARNIGWRRASAPWIVFLDDDVVPGEGWRQRLQHDLAAVHGDPSVAAVQGRISVPLPAGRRPTDWQRQVAGLATAGWITADIAYRRAVLDQVGGFDERFPRAYREDADLAVRVSAAGYRLVRGERETIHPVGPARPLASVSRQRGNADDALMRRLHGRHWRRRAGVPPGRRPWHAATTALGLAALAALAARQRRAALATGLGWLGLTTDFAARRIAAGPRTPGEVSSMIVSSVLIPPAASWYWLRGWLAHRRTDG